MASLAVEPDRMARFARTWELKVGGKAQRHGQWQVRIAAAAHGP